MRDGKTYYVMTDAAAFREGAGRLLAEVQRIKSEGDYDAARTLFDRYGIHFDPALRDEVVARVDALQPALLHRDRDAAIDAALSRWRDRRRRDFLSAATWRRRCSSIPRSRAPPMLSRRLPPHADLNALTRALAQQRSEGRPIIDLTESNPDARRHSRIRPICSRPSASDAALRYEPHAFGLPSAREAIARDHARRGVTIDPDHDRPRGEHERSLHVAVQAAVRPGRHGARAAPKLSAFRASHASRRCRRGSVRPRIPRPMGNRLRHAGRALRASTRAIVIVSPNNPTGSYVTARELDRLFAVCRERGWALIADEVFADYPLDVDAPVTDIAAGADVLAFTLGGLSKSAGLPQLKLGWIVAGGRPTARAAALAGLELIADSFLSVSTPVQVAAADLLEHGASIRSTDSRARARQPRGASRRRALVRRVRRIEDRRRLVGHHPRARDANRGTAHPRSARSRRHPRASRIFLRLSARSVRGRQPLSEPCSRRVDTTARFARRRWPSCCSSRHSLALRTRPPYDASATRITPRRGADPAVFDSLVSELGHRRNRRHRSDRRLARCRRATNPAAASDQRNAARRDRRPIPR